MAGAGAGSDGSTQEAAAADASGVDGVQEEAARVTARPLGGSGCRGRRHEKVRV